MSKLIIITSLTILLVLGVWYGGRLSNTDVAPLEREASPNEGMLVTGPAVPPGEPVTNIMGRILSISGNTITMTAESPVGMSDDPALQERTVTLSEVTVVSTFTERDSELVKQEIEDLKKRIAENERVEAEARAAGADIPPTPVIEIPEGLPTVYDKQEVGRGELVVGQIVNVAAEADVRTAKSFSATSIDIIPLAPPR
jgi:hypothetical protein